MKAISQNEYGPATVLHIAETAKPSYAPNQVLIRVKASGINPIDAKVRAGYMQQVIPKSFPFILGWEASGIVVAVGGEVNRFRVGDEVYTHINMLEGGAYAEYVAVNEADTAKKPTTISHLQAATVPMGANTAYNALVKIANLQKGQKLLLHGAAGTVGFFAVQLAKKLGAYVIGTAAGQGIALVKSLGADEVIDYTTTDFETVVKDVDLVLDLVGGETQQKSYSVLKKGGLLLSSVPPLLAPEKAADYGIRAESFMTLPDATVLTLVAQWIDEGKLKTPEPLVFTISEAAEAHEIMEKRTAKTKLVFEL